nr:unnamed protein product [Callosobruchus chinensis]
MYMYYLLAGMGIRNLWWKKYITVMQLVSTRGTWVHSEGFFKSKASAAAGR